MCDFKRPLPSDATRRLSRRREYDHLRGLGGCQDAAESHQTDWAYDCLFGSIFATPQGSIRLSRSRSSAIGSRAMPSLVQRCSGPIPSCDTSSCWSRACSGVEEVEVASPDICCRTPSDTTSFLQPALRGARPSRRPRRVWTWRSPRSNLLMVPLRSAPSLRRSPRTCPQTQRSPRSSPSVEWKMRL